MTPITNPVILLWILGLQTISLAHSNEKKTIGAVLMFAGWVLNLVLCILNIK